MVQIGEREITTPAICASVIGKKITDLERGSDKALEKSADIIEFRMDKLEDFTDLDSLLSSNLPSIVTNRSVKEGGHFDGGERERIQVLLDAIEKGVSCVDIELSSSRELIEEVIKTAENYETSVILSHHNFEEVPSLEELQEKVREMNNYDYDFGKIIGFSNKYKDSIRMLKFLIQSLEKEKNHKIIAFAMGDKGEFTRITAPLLGSPIAYASVEEETAPGQLSVTDLREILDKYRSEEIDKETPHL